VSHLLSERGEFNLAGVLVAMTLFAGILGATLMTFEQFQQVDRDTVDRADSQDRSRITADRLTRELRNLASPTPDRPESVDRAQPYDVIFQSVDPLGPNAGANAANVMRVRYCLDDSQSNASLWRQEQRWTTALPPAVPADTACPGSSWPSQAAVADHLVNRRDGLDRPVFSYNGATSTTDVLSVRTDLYIDLDVLRKPRETRIATGVHLRNQNRRPIAAFEPPKVNSSNITLNGSLSSDPEGEAMRFLWYDGTTKVGEGITFTYVPVSRGQRVISLKVYDPANLEGVAPAVTVTW